jgi:hypothetical protein
VRVTASFQHCHRGKATGAVANIRTFPGTTRQNGATAGTAFKCVSACAAQSRRTKAYDASMKRRGYARVSTDGQSLELKSLDAQFDAEAWSRVLDLLERR